MTETPLSNTKFGQAEDPLPQSQQRLQAIFDHSLDAILLANDEGQYVEVNPAACQLTGYSQEELLKLRVWDLTPQTNLEQGRALWQAFLDAGSQSGEYTLTSKSGALVEVEYRATAHITPGLHLSLLRDITKRKQAEEALRQSEERFEQITQNVDIVFYITDLPGPYVRYISPAFERLWGLSAAELYHDQAYWLKHMHPEDRARTSAIFEAFIAGGPPYNAEYRIRLADSVERWVHDRAIVVDRDATGKISRIIGIAENITERKQAEVALLERNLRLALLSQTSERLIMNAGPELDILHSTFTEVSAVLGLELFFHFQPAEQPPTLQLITSYGLTAAERKHYATIQVGQYLCGQVAERRARLVAENLADSPYPEAAELRATGVLAYAGFPLVIQEQFMGTVAFATRNRAQFSEGELQLIQTVCDQVASWLARTRSERRLHQSEERLSFSLYAAQAGAWNWDISSGDVTWSVENYQLYDIDPAIRPLRYEDWESRVHPEDLARTNQVIADTVAGKLPEYRTEFRVIRRDGRILWLLGLGRVQYAVDGITPLRMSGLNLDITARKQIEEKLRGSEEQTRLILAASKIGLWIVDAATRHVYWSPQNYEIFGVDEFDGQIETFQRFVHPDDLAMVWAKFSHAFEQGGQYQAEFRIIRPDGQLRWVGNYGHAEFDAAGQPLRFLGTAFDITERKQAEEALREGEYRLRIASDAATIGIHDYDISQNQVMWDDKVRTIWGVAPDEKITYETFVAGLHPADLALTQAAVDQALDPTGDGKYQAEYRVIHRRSGEVRWVAATGQVFFEAGQAVRLIGTAQDITTRKRVEADQQLLVEVSRLLTTSLNMADRLQTLAELLVEEFADWCVLNLLAPDGAIQLSVAEHHVPEKTALIYELAQAYPLEPETSVTLNLIHSRQAKLSSSFVEDLPTEYAQDDSFRRFLTELGRGSTIIVPLIAQERTLGAITLVRAETRSPFNKVDLALSEELAYRTAIAVDNVRLYEAERAARLEAEAAQQSLALLAEMRERNRLAQELHDTVAQALGYLNLKVSMTLASLNQEQLETARANLQELKQVINETYTDVREEIFNLRSKTEASLSFIEMLHRYHDKYERFYKMDIQLLQEAEMALFDFPAEIAAQVIRTIQEALINIRKHAGVNSALIRLGHENGQPCIMIEDQGKGFDLAEAGGKASSFGLKIMQDRIESVGGHLEVESAPNRGTQVMLRLK